MRRGYSIRNLVITFAVLLCTNGCVVPGSKPASEEYEGKLIDVLLHSLGPADKTAELQKGYIYRWDLEQEEFNEGRGVYGYSLTYRCEVTAVTDKNGVIKTFRTQSIDNYSYVDACGKLMRQLAP